MSEIENHFFSLMVVGENPDEMVKKYDSTIQSEPYIKYYYDDASKIRKKSIKMMQDLLDNSDKASLNKPIVEYFKERVKALKSMTDFEYYTSLTSGLTYDKDGNALTTENKYGKYSTCRIGRNLCIPLKLKNGNESFNAYKKDIDWDKMHMVNQELYRTAWELFHGERTPQNEQEEKIYDNIKGQNRYFEGFDSVDDYINYNCSYWNYAYLDKDGWVDADDYKNYEWITSFYKNFVEKIPDDALISIYECSK